MKNGLRLIALLAVLALVAAACGDDTSDTTVAPSTTATTADTGDTTTTTEDVMMGPLSNGNQFEKVGLLIEKGVEEGARVAAGGPGRPGGLNRDSW